MTTRVRKWGNSLALRIPKSFAEKVGLCEDLAVDLSVREGRLVVQPHAVAAPTLDELLAKVTDEDIHGEWEVGSHLPEAGEYSPREVATPGKED